MVGSIFLTLGITLAVIVISLEIVNYVMLKYSVTVGLLVSAIILALFGLALWSLGI